MKIGIFDSGMGGLSVLHRALRMIPEADFLYYADEEHVPYGEKTREQVRGYIDEIIAFMIKKQVDAIVIACNTVWPQKNTEVSFHCRLWAWNRQ
mgnify:CR=1 FL=1